jgi:hypothetical protein
MSKIGSGWNTINKGLISSDTMKQMLAGLISGGTMTPEQMEQGATQAANAGDPKAAAITRFLTGATGSAANVASSLTSPVSLGLAAATLGGSALPESAVATRAALTVPQLAASGAFAAQGGKQALTGRQPGENTADMLERRLSGGAQLAGGLAGAASGLTTPASKVELAHQQISKDMYTRGLGVSAKLKEVHDTLKAQEGQAAQQLISKVDTAHPEGSVEAKATVDHMNEALAKVKTPEKLPQSLATLYDINQLGSTSGKWDIATAIQMKTKIGAAMADAEGPMKAALTSTYNDLKTQIGKAARDNGALNEWTSYNDLSRRRFNHFVNDPIVSKIMNGITAPQTLGKLTPDNMAHLENTLGQYKNLGLDPEDLRSEGEDYSKSKEFAKAKGFRWWPYGTVGGLAGRAAGIGYVPGIVAGLGAERILGSGGAVRRFAASSSDSPFYDLGEQKAAALQQGLKNIPPNKVSLKSAEQATPSRGTVGAKQSAIEGARINRPEWLEGQRTYEINRLNEILRNPKATQEERSIAQSQLDNYK